ncbi:hypothetical protein [Eubacterium oxidoreducens]|uniref:TadE-like protein n=1 Tax=Eubacterium oxidoreducens TaxID=1732 RepID=A0A1G6A002_EUBOX|nr:hypothetical protein [Eubacterium oxidoreducens]SDB01742.1 hypothetical protein SAMN02910417_00060 [Eubacterium oxidoreducens]
MYLKGSYTIEAALIFPLILIVLACAVKISVDFFREEMVYVERVSEIVDTKPVKTIRTSEIAKKVMEIVK